MLLNGIHQQNTTRVVSSDSSDILLIKFSLPPKHGCLTVKNYKIARK